mmetsp:Transcript_1219/g.1445  ORF Transcript_1219/g.1445 Transcript_1219/m.1445 type:complete len:125 (+) Transcript_1219:133-507(+)
MPELSVEQLTSIAFDRVFVEAKAYLKGTDRRCDWQPSILDDVVVKEESTPEVTDTNNVTNRKKKASKRPVDKIALKLIKKLKKLNSEKEATVSAAQSKTELITEKEKEIPGKNEDSQDDEVDLI